MPHRINLWDTATGAVAHQIALPAGLPYNLDVSPNGRYLVAMLEDGEAGMKLSVWRLDGEMGVQAPWACGPCIWSATLIWTDCASFIDHRGLACFGPTRRRSRNSIRAMGRKIASCEVSQACDAVHCSVARLDTPCGGLFSTAHVREL